MLKKFKDLKKLIKDKKNKKMLYIIVSFLLLNLIAGIYFIYSLSLLSGIETIIRYGVIIFAIIMIFIFGYFGINSLLKNKLKLYIPFFILIVISISTQGIVGFTIDKYVYKTISGINKSEITYTTSLITLKNNKIEKVSDIKDMKIGIISKDKGLEDYTIGQQILSENKLKNENEIKEYNDYFEMLNDLYEKKIDCMFVSSNYSIMFSSYEKFTNIKDDVKVIIEASKEFKKQETTNLVSNKNIVKEPFTVLLMGVDSETDGLDKNAAFNGDSLMLITFNPTTLNATVLSIPRDTYVPIMCFKNQKQNKITHAAWYGVSCMEKTIENFTGIDIDYYVKMNFKGVVNLVDALGGIDVNVPFQFCEQDSNRDWGENTICLSPGEQHLNGEQALALARHRKTLALGDIQRGLNQQIVIQGLLSKLTTLDSLDKVNNILNTVSKNMDTNISTNQMLSFYNVGKDILLRSVHTSTSDLISMEKLYLDGYTKMIYDDGFKMNLSNYVYYKSSLEAVVEAMKINLGEKSATLDKSFEFSINEIYEKKIIGQGEKDSESNIVTLPNFVGKTKTYVSNWCSSHNIKAIFNTITEGDNEYKDTYSDGEIISQSVPKGKEVNKIKSITFNVISKSVSEKNDENKIKDNEKETTETSVCPKDTKNQKCFMPNLIGKTKKDVDKWSTTLPISLIINFDSSNCSNDTCIVESVTKDGGSAVKSGTNLSDLEKSKITIKLKKSSTTETENTEEKEENNNENTETDKGTENNPTDVETKDPALENSGVTDNNSEDNKEEINS